MLVSVDKFDALKAQRTRVSTSDTRDPGWTAPSDAFLRLTHVAGGILHQPRGARLIDAGISSVT